MEGMNVISERLRTFRNRQGLNQTGVAKVAGMSQRAWAGWEEEPPNALKSLVALAVHYGVSVDYLLALTDDETPRRAKWSEDMQELMQCARTLPAHRLRDLLLVARAYADDGAKPSAANDAEAKRRTEAGIEATMNVYTRRYGQSAADQLIESLKPQFPELGDITGPTKDQPLQRGE
jgi:transcriptional regulator with XRE-family HTH domain